jgi:hypothetical protein
MTGELKKQIEEIKQYMQSEGWRIHDVSEGLMFIEAFYGADLVWFCPDNERVSTFRTEFSSNELSTCKRAADQRKVKWESADGSLTLSGTSQKIKFIFRSNTLIRFEQVLPITKTRTITLESESLASFKALLDLLSLNKMIYSPQA